MLITLNRYAEVEEMLAMRQATFGSLAKRTHLRTRSGTDHIGEREARKLEAKTLIEICKMARKHEILQNAITASTQLENLVQPCKDVGLDISGVAALQAANVLWLDGQAVPAIDILSTLVQGNGLASQSIEVGRAKLLATLVRPREYHSVRVLLTLHLREVGSRKHGLKSPTGS